MTACRYAILAACIVASAAGTWAQTPRAQTTPPAATFEARADLVLVDVNVLDGQGRPVTDLKAGDFELEVAGRSRRLQSARFISSVAVPDAAAPASTRLSQTSSNTAAGNGRVLLIAVDEAHLRFGANRAVLQTAERLLERLAPGDLVGVSRLSGGTGVEFTTNRALVRDALRTVNGRVSAARSTSLRLSEAHDFEHGDRSIWVRVIARECLPPSDPSYQACVDTLEGDARDIIRDQESATATTIASLEGLTTRLRTLRQPVNLILISEGLYAGTGTAAAPALSRLASLAAAARVSLTIVRPAPELFDMQNGDNSSSNRDEDRVLRNGLEQLSGRMRGGLFTATGTGAGVFDRISSELSGYYLLGFEPTEQERAGGDRGIKVTVKRRGVTVRARPSFAILPPEPEPATPAERLQRIMTAPLPTAGLPITVATYQSTSTENGQVRVLIGAEIGEPIGGTSTIPVGVIVLDKAGKIVTNSLIDAAELKPSTPSQMSPGLFLTAVALAPGDYTLRLGAIGPNGSAGVVHHAFTAGLRRLDGGLAVSDIVMAAGRDGLRPSPSAIVTADQMVVFLEGQHQDAAALERVKVSFDIRQPSKPAALVTAAAGSEARSNGSQRSFTAGIALSALPPGEYIVRALVEAPGRPPASIERPFLLERPAATAAAAAGAPIVRPAPPPILDRIRVPAQRFAVDDVLRPEVVNAFLDTLQARHPPTNAVRPVLEEARAGRFLARTEAASGNDDVILSFIGALAALKQGQVPQAMTLFQRTLRAAPDFVGLAFYMGASHAAAGRDREAAGAWQMALLNDEARSAYPLLVDALLRVGEGQRALDVLQRSSEAWTTGRDKQRREVLAEAAAGRYPEAAAKLRALIESGGGDPDLWFLGIQLLYRQHLAAPLSGSDLSRFDDWTRRYVQANGPESVAVAAWRSQVIR
jgi:VWFA-related protein